MKVRVPIVDDSPAMQTFIRPVSEMSGLMRCRAGRRVVVVPADRPEAWTRRMLKPEARNTSRSLSRQNACA